MGEIEELVLKLTEASDKYYNSDTPLMSDSAFDLLRDRLKEIDPQNPFLKTVGAPVLGESIKHVIPVGSQEKVKDRKEFDDFISKLKAEGETEFGLDHKLDGLTCCLSYEKGRLVRALSKGSGLVGEDMTENVLQMSNVKKNLSDKGFTGILRGELMLSISDFKKVFAPLGYKNPRNTVSGVSRDRKGNPFFRYIKPVYFDINWLTESAVKKETISDLLNYVKFLGLEVVEHKVLTSPDGIWDLYKQIEQQRPNLDFELDGVIVKAEHLDIREGLGMSSDLRPKSERAVKFASLGAITKLLSILVTEGHTGNQIPTGKVSPVQIGGVTVSSVLLNNYDYIANLGLAIGADVLIERAGDVIPFCSSVVKKDENCTPIPIPNKCVGCGGPLVKNGVHLTCMNDECEGKAIRRLKNWLTKRSIKFIGDELLSTLWENGIKEPQDLYKLTEQQLGKLPRGAGVVGSASKQIMAELNKSKTCSLSEFMGSLAVKYLGRRQAEIMIKQGIDSLEKWVTLTVDQLNALPGFSDDGTKAVGIVDGIKKVRPVIKALLEAGIEIEAVAQEPAVNPNGPLVGKIFVFTGALPSGTARSVAWDLTRQAGGQIKDSMTKGVTYLVCASPDSTSSKTIKAKRYGIKCISEEDWQKMLKDGPPQ